MKHGNAIRLTAFFLLQLLLVQVLTVAVCAANARREPAPQHRQKHTEAHPCCNATPAPFIGTGRLYTAAVPGDIVPGTFRLYPPPPFVGYLLHNRPARRPAYTERRLFHPYAPGTRIAIQRFQI